ARREFQRWQGRGEDVDQSERRVIDHQMPAALLAVLPLAHGRFFDRCDVLGTFSDAHRDGLPERKRVHRAAGPRSAGSAVAIAHAFGLARGLDFDRSAETFTFVRRHCLTSFIWAPRHRGPSARDLSRGAANANDRTSELLDT